MDIIVEYMVKKKRTTADIIKILGCFLGVLVVLALIPMLVAIPYIGPIAFLLCFGLIYFLIRLVGATKLEYEYCFTNGLMDVDKILNMRNRKRMTELNAREIDVMASTKDRGFKLHMEDKSVKKVYACTNVDDEGVYYILYSENGVTKMLLFNPNDEIKDGFKRYNPQKVILDD